MIRAQRMDPSRLPQPVTAVLSLGSNLGDREATLRAAVRDIAALDGVAVTAVSGLVQTPALKPQGVDTDAPAYLNAVLVVVSTLAPIDLLAAVNAIEDAHGRVRDERWGDRTLDIDIVAAGSLRSDDTALTLPHPRAASRAFVLAPWLQVAPDAELPGLGRVDVLLSRIENDATPYPAEALL